MMSLAVSRTSICLQSILLTKGCITTSRHARSLSVLFYQPSLDSKLVQDHRNPTSLTVTSLLSYVPVRHANFFNKHSAEELWSGVVSVSKQGKMKGRGRGKRTKNLNLGQTIGKGEMKVNWPGLNAPVIQKREVNVQRVIGPDIEYKEKLIELRDKQASRRSRAIHPLERGWSGTKWGGRRLGPPDPVGDELFEGFETMCLEFKIVNHMTGQHGRRRSFSSFCVTGNGNGLAGFGLAKSPTGAISLRMAKNKAAQQLLHVDRYEGHSVLHDFFTSFGNTRIFVKKMHRGYGLVCHRAIREICKMFGISDIHAKVEGAINIQNITKAFFLGLLNQRTYQRLADEKQLHLVEFREENLDYPTVLASPKGAPVRTLAQIDPNENLNVNIHCMDDRVPLVKKKYPPFYVGTRGYEKYLKSYQYRRNDHEVKKELYKDYGELKSFYFDQHPECITNYYHHLNPKADEDEYD